MTLIRTIRPDRSAGLLLVAAFLVSVGLLLASARPVVACSCAMPGPIEDYATADNAVFTGTAGLKLDRGVPVEVTQWLWGKGAAPVVWLNATSFGDSASCGVAPPTPDTSWLWVAFALEDGTFGTGLCSLYGQLGTPEGDAMLAEALAVFDGVAPPGAEPTPGVPLPTAAPGPEEIARDTSGLLVGGGVVLASLALFGGLVLVARRQDRSSG